MTLWKPIPFLPEGFEASDDGRVRRLAYEKVYVRSDGITITRQIKGRILKWRMGKPSWRGIKHPIVGIYKGTCRGDSKNVDTRIAYCVAAAFYGVPWTEPNDRHKWRIRFRDGNHLNCYAINLEWVHSFGELGSDAQARYERNKDAYEASRGVMPTWMADYYADEEDAA